MKKRAAFLAFSVLSLALAGCADQTIQPSYTSDDTDLMQIGGNEPRAKEPVIVNLGSYCLQEQEAWKEGGKTPDGQIIWTKNSYRQVVPCK